MKFKLRVSSVEHTHVTEGNVLTRVALTKDEDVYGPIKPTFRSRRDAGDKVDIEIADISRDVVQLKTHGKALESYKPGMVVDVEINVPAQDVPGSYLAGQECMYTDPEECPDIDCSHNVGRDK